MEKKIKVSESKKTTLKAILISSMAILCLTFWAIFITHLDVLAFENNASVGDGLKQNVFPHLPSYYLLAIPVFYFLFAEILYAMLIIWGESYYSLTEKKKQAFGWATWGTGLEFVLIFPFALMVYHIVGVILFILIMVAAVGLIALAIKGVIWLNMKFGQFIEKYR